MKVLGIDPGFGRCGVAIVTKEDGKERVIYSTCIETPAGHSFPERLVQVVDVCEQLLEEHKPRGIALERLYFNTNQKTAMQVAEVRGAIIYAAQRAGVSISEYTPAQVKAAITGWGRSDKQGVARMLKTLLHIEKDIEFDDEYDAIAVGVTHLAHTR